MELIRTEEGNRISIDIIQRIDVIEDCQVEQRKFKVIATLKQCSQCDCEEMEVLHSAETREEAICYLDLIME